MQELSEALAQTLSEIAALEAALEAALADDYPPQRMSALLTEFMRWYLGSGELLSPSFLHTFNGIHYAPMTRACLPLMLQLRYGLEDALGPHYRGCTYLYNGQIALCNMDDEEALSLLYNYIRLKEGTRIIDSASSEFSSAGGKASVIRQTEAAEAGGPGKPKPKREDKIRRILSFGRRSSASLAGESAQAEHCTRAWVGEQLSASGFLTRSWGDSDDLEALTAGDLRDMARGAGGLIWCPRYARVGSSSAAEADRVVLYRHGRFIVVLQVAAQALHADNALALLTAVQSNLSASIPQLNEAVEAALREQSAGAAQSGSAPPPQSPQAAPTRDKAGARIPQIRIFYANDCVKAIKVSGSKVWTPALPKPMMSPPGARARDGRPAAALSAEQLFQEPLLYAAATRASLLGEEVAAGLCELGQDEVAALVALAASGAFKYASPSSHIASKNCAVFPLQEYCPL